MIICSTRSELAKARSEINFNEKLGFVPTMGNLHQGHLSLIYQSLVENNCSIVSIFVNPLQFGENEDFGKYPRTLDKDLELIKSEWDKMPKAKKLIVFTPKNREEVFGENPKTIISVQGLNNIIEGSDRPGHFDGVTTVVFKLFQLIKPHIAYFGAKDFQQQLLIKQMVKDLLLPVVIKTLPTVRDETGLALSSRNHYLTETEKKEGLKLLKALQQLKNELTKNFETHRKISLDEFEKERLKVIEGNPSLTYLEARNSKDFSPLLETTLSVVIVGAYRIAGIRLLDNLEFLLGDDLGA